MTTSLFLILLFFAAIIVYLIYQPILKNKKRIAIKHQTFPKQWEMEISSYWSLYLNLPDLLKQNLQNQIKLFLSEKQFTGCNGFDVKEHHKLLIAAQACLLIINKPFNYFDNLKSILIYPSAFVVSHQQMLENGTVVHEANVNIGEAWETGKIVLSWDAAYSGMINLKDGHNVVIHEFAHLLDNTSGSTNGAPLLEHATDQQPWSQAFSSAFVRLQNNLSKGHKSFFDPYGATNPAEFFAVVSEVFFEKSKLFQKHEPELYQQLVKFYAVDPTVW